MSKYQRLRMALSLFSVQDGFEPDFAREAFHGSIASESSRRALEDELQQALADTNLSWRELLCNEDYEVDDVETEDEAKAIVLDLLRLPT